MLDQADLMADRARRGLGEGTITGIDGDLPAIRTHTSGGAAVSRSAVR
jgi:hypothetical protein